MKKIEISILSIILVEALFLLLFFKYSFMNIILGIILGISLVYLTKNIKKNVVTKTILIITSGLFYLLFNYQTALFISNNLLKNYSLFLIISSLIIITFYIVKKKYHTFIKTCELLFYLVIIIKIISIILVIPLININNLQISFDYNYQLIIVALFILYLYKSIYYLNNYQLKNSELLISFISPLCIKLLALLVIGNTLSNLYNYPYVIYLKKIKYFNFIERMDGILSFEYIFCFIVLISYTLLNTKKSQ